MLHTDFLRRSLNTDESRLIRRAFEDAIHDILIKSANDSIVGPDSAGAFPAAPFGSIVTGRTFLVVPDTNYLLRDITHGCMHGRRVLVSAANNGFLRLYCPPHVIDEVYEKAQETCERARRKGEPQRLDDFLECWETEYLPLLRYVDSPESLIRILTPAERTRLDVLRRSDPDDVPAAILAIALNAFFLSWDGPALQAVYGRTATNRELRDQIVTLMEGGRVGTASEMIALLLLLPASALQTVRETFSALNELAPWAPWLLAAAAIAIVLSLTDAQRSALGSFISAVLKVMRELYDVYQQAVERLDASGPGDPDWSDLVVTLGRRNTLLRAGLHTLARLPDGVTTARTLVLRLPHLNVGQGEKLIWDMLRSTPCFTKPYIGTWQVARPVAPRTVDDSIVSS